MYDPHPDNPGPWFKSHFSRFLHDDEEDDVVIEDDDSHSSILFLRILGVVVLCFVMYAAVITVTDLGAGDVLYYVVVPPE